MSPEELGKVLENANKLFEEATATQLVNKKLTSVIIELHQQPLFKEEVERLLKLNGLNIENQ